jgi:proteasome lid subunit RPN8/RPN11
VEITLASDPEIAAIRLPFLLWREVIVQLRRRGAGKGESGAFLLGLQRGTSARVMTYICYDDLDPHAYQSGAIAFHAAGYAALWQYCREKKLQVLADVHTHPGKGIWQSPMDQQNPMVPVVGHTAIIVPNFARTPWWSLKTVAVYEYLGNFTWRTHGVSEKPRRINLTVW